jgi:signal transduction histidine kinase
MASLYLHAVDKGVGPLAERLRSERHALVRRWQDELNGPSLRGGVPARAEANEALSDVIAELAGRLIEDAFGDGPGRREALRAAALLGELRFTQKTPIGHVVDEWHALEGVLQAFIRQEARTFVPPMDESAVTSASQLVQFEIRTLERRALESYSAGYERTIDRLTTQLRRVSRRVIHEIRRPLSVLRVLARTLTVADGDVDAVRMMDILDRSVERLAEVTRELDRDSGVTHPREA